MPGSVVACVNPPDKLNVLCVYPDPVLPLKSGEPLGMVMKAVTTAVTAVAREKSRREIAAYIAEGSMTPDQGERLLAADVNGRGSEKG